MGEFRLAEDANGKLAWQAGYVPGLGPAARQDAAAYQHLPPQQETVMACTDFSRGLGIYEQDPQRPETWFGYNYSNGVDLRDGYARVMPRWITSGLAPDPTTLGLNGVVYGDGVWQGKRYVLAGWAIYRLEYILGVWQWSLWYDPGSGTGLCMGVFGNYLLAQWEGENYFHIWNNPADNTSGPMGGGTPTHQPVLNTATMAFVGLGERLFLFVQNRTVYAFNDVLDTTLTDWYSWNVGDASYDFNAAWVARDVVWIGKDEGLFAIDQDSRGGEAASIINLRTLPSNNNFRIHECWGDWIWATYGVGGKDLLTYDMNTGELHLSGFHPRDIAPQTPQYHGAVVAMAVGDGSHLYMAVTNKAVNASGTLIGYNHSLIEVSRRQNGEFIYQVVGGEESQPAYMMIDHMSGINRPVIWWFRNASPYQPAYIILSDGAVPENDATCQFDVGTGNYFVTSWLYGDFVDISKAFYNLQRECRNLTASQTVNIAYQVNDATDSDAWTNLVTWSSGNGFQSTPTYFPNGLTPKRIRFKVTLYTAVTNKTPILEKLLAHCRLMQPKVKAFSLTIICATDSPSHSAREMRNTFFTLAELDAAITLTDMEGKPYIGNILRDTSLAEMAYFDQKNPVYAISFVFLEADALGG